MVVIDDLGTEKISSWALDKLYTIIVNRNENKLPIIIMTKFDKDSLLHRFYQSNDKELSKAIIQKLYQMCYGIILKRYDENQKEKSLIDADVDFFEDRIRQYEDLLEIEHNEKWWNEDMDIKQLCKYFDKKDITVRKAIKKMCESGFGEYKWLVGSKVVISKEGVKWICNNVFKQKYLELLEKYKMELTDLYIAEGYPYDNFFGRN